MLKMYKRLTEAATQLVNGDPDLMLQLVSEIEKQAFEDAYNHAIETLQETINKAQESNEVIL